VTPLLYAVGKVVKAFGIKGEVVVESMTSAAGRFKALKSVFVGRNDRDVESSTVEYVRVEGRKGVRVKLSSVQSRNDAELLVGAYVFVQKNDRVRLSRGTFFVEDLLGIQVIDEMGKHIGFLNDVLKLPAQDVYVIEGDGREVMIPATREFIREIDLDARTMKVELIEGLVERL